MAAIAEELEGTWDEIAATHAPALRGRRVKVLVFEEPAPPPADAEPRPPATPESWNALFGRMEAVAEQPPERLGGGDPLMDLLVTKHRKRGLALRDVPEPPGTEGSDAD